MANLITRERKSNDLPTLFTVLESVHRTDGYPVDGVKDALSFLSPPDVIYAWVATINDQVIGHVLVCEPKPGDSAVTAWANQGGDPSLAAVMGRLFVDSKARVKGAGKLLVQTAAEWAGSSGKRLLLEVLDSRRAARAIYEGLGWHRIGESVHGNGQGGRFTTGLYISP
jgi:GNAT superfamily N-acetyltransferase